MNIQNNDPTSPNGSDEFEKFIYLLSHDLRNSVRALLEVPLWIEEDLIESKIAIEGSLAENLNLMNIHTRRLDRMLIDLLSYSRVGRKQIVTAINLENALGMVLGQIRIPRGFNLTIALKHTEIRIGERDILTLFSELITNAIKHNVTGSGNIEISSHHLDNNCIIRVQDDGPGIPFKYRQRVLEAMTTLKPRDEVEGSGMGLATVSKIVKTYGGCLQLLPPQNHHGTTFEIQLPI
jgi:signal transduction histidine kinase